MSETPPSDTEKDGSQRFVEAALRGDMAVFSAAEASSVNDWKGFGKVIIKVRSTITGKSMKASVFDDRGWTELEAEVDALYAASYSGQEKIVEWLLAHGADVNTEFHQGWATVAAARQGHVKIVQKLVDHGASQNSCEQALIEATELNNLEIVQLLISKHVVGPSALLHAMAMASSKGFVDTVRALTLELERMHESKMKNFLQEGRQRIDELEKMCRQTSIEMQRAQHVMGANNHKQIGLLREEMKEMREEFDNLLLHMRNVIRSENDAKISRLQKEFKGDDDKLWRDIKKERIALNQTINELKSQMETPRNFYKTQAFIKGCEFCLSSICIGVGKLLKKWETAKKVRFALFIIVAVIALVAGIFTICKAPHVERLRSNNSTYWFILVYVSIVVAATGFL